MGLFYIAPRRDVNVAITSRTHYKKKNPKRIIKQFLYSVNIRVSLWLGKSLDLACYTIYSHNKQDMYKVLACIEQQCLIVHILGYTVNCIDVIQESKDP